MRRWGVGVTVGKFNPPHLGHAHLVNTAAAQCEQVFVLCGDRSDQTLPAEDRATWLGDAVDDNVTILVTPDDIAEANEPWARRALEVLPERPQVAFTSEEWGPGWASAMGCRHVSVDLPRATHPVSATMLRSDLAANFGQLVPAARAALARRVVLVGAESTGKTTLAEALAERLRTVWVPEVGRYYALGRSTAGEPRWRSDEFERIAQAQCRLEDDLARLADHGVLVADTDALVTAVWQRRYGCGDSETVDRISSARVPDLYVVCDTDIEWSQDGTRESGSQREWMQQAMVDRVVESGAPHVLLRGSLDDRLADALEAIRPFAEFGELT